MPTNSSSWSKHILTSEYKCCSLSCIKLTLELCLTLIKKKGFHEKYIYPFLVQHLKTFLLQQQSRAHLESWWALVCSLLLRKIPSIYRVPCLGCSYPSTIFLCTAHQKHANHAPASWNHCCSGQWKSETEMPLTVENYTWSRIMIASWMQLPGTLKYDFFSFPFSLTKDKYRDQASFSGIYTILTAQS